MISEEQIDWAIKVMESPRTHPLTKQAASKIVDAFLRQEYQTLDWEHQCYLSVNLARMAAHRYGNRARTR